MARIEIDYLEYQGLKATIENLQKENISLKKDIDLLKEEKNKLLEDKDDILNSRIIDRLFNWKNIIKDYGSSK